MPPTPGERIAMSRRPMNGCGAQCHHRPDDETFDAVCCFGALYLMPEPFRVAHEMVRTLRPGGWVAIFTTYSADRGRAAMPDR